MINNQGYVVIPNLFSKQDLENIKINTTDYEYPYNLNSVPRFSKIELDCSKVIKVAEELTNKNYNIFQKKLLYKSAWEGVGEPWHQDFIYRNNLNISSDLYLSCWIALDDINHCPLDILENSHKFGLLEHDLIIKPNLESQYKVVSSEMNKIKEQCNWVSIKLNFGDAIFFDYLLIHGSGSNMSPNDQKRIILLLLDNKIKITQYEKNISLLHVSDRRTLEKDILKKALLKKENG